MDNLKRVIVDFKKLTPEVLKLLVEKYPDGYDDAHIITFKNASGERIEAVEVTTDDTKYLVKISAKLEVTMANYDEDDYEDFDDDDPDMKQSAFHLALPCYSVTRTRNFYVDILGAKLGRHSTQWADINLFGNQITFTKSGEFSFTYKSYKFEDQVLPSFHFGVILDEKTWKTVHQKLIVNIEGITEAITFLKNKSGEHTSFFVEDPNGYVVEFKCFKEAKQVFAS